MDTPADRIPVPLTLHYLHNIPSRHICAKAFVQPVNEVVEVLLIITYPVTNHLCPIPVQMVGQREASRRCSRATRLHNVMHVVRTVKWGRRAVTAEVPPPGLPAD